MKPNKKAIPILGILLVIFASLSYSYILPVVNDFYSGVKAYETRTAYRDNYKLHTKPLPKDVVDSICLKLDIQATSEHCKVGMMVYVPELFKDIEAYFNNLPDQDKTYDTVQNKLGRYLVACEQSDPDGNYRCRYDLQGDGVYPVSFYFDKDGFYWQIRIRSVGGS